MASDELSCSYIWVEYTVYELCWSSVGPSYVTTDIQNVACVLWHLQGKPFYCLRSANGDRRLHPPSLVSYSFSLSPPLSSLLFSLPLSPCASVSFSSVMFFQVHWAIVNISSVVEAKIWTAAAYNDTLPCLHDGHKTKTSSRERGEQREGHLGGWSLCC